MKLLHTADWHLGVKTGSRDRLAEQKKIVDEICEIAEREDVDIVLLCGDIFQNSVPSSESEDVFISALEKLSGDGRRVIVALAGNHDDPKRLMAYSHLAKKHNIILVGDLAHIKFHKTNSAVRVGKSGCGWIEILKGDESTVIGALPFPVQYRISHTVESENYSAQVKEWASVCAKGFKRGSFNVFASHLMVSSSTLDSNGEYFSTRIGDAFTSDKSSLPKADYVALGHIHIPQFVGKSNNIYYSGAPIKLGFQYEKFVVAIVEGNSKGLVSHREIALSSPQKMESVKVFSVSEAENVLKEFDDCDLVEVTFVQDTPLSSFDMKELRQKFPCILSLRFETKTEQKDDREFVVNRKHLSLRDIFEGFFERKTAKKPSPEITQLFLEVMEESDETN